MIARNLLKMEIKLDEEIDQEFAERCRVMDQTIYFSLAGVTTLPAIFGFFLHPVIGGVLLLNPASLFCVGYFVFAGDKSDE